MTELADYRILDLGIITLEWTTALFTVLLFLIVAYLMNELLFKPVVKNMEQRQKFIDQNNAKHLVNQDGIKKLNEAIDHDKLRYWDDIRRRQREVIRESEIEANKLLQEKQALLRRSTDREKEVLTKIIQELPPKSVNEISDLSKTLLDKIS